jgi:hypothetical protein
LFGAPTALSPAGFRRRHAAMRDDDATRRERALPIEAGSHQGKTGIDC